MQQRKLVFFYVLAGLLALAYRAEAQKDRKYALSIYPGVVFFSQNEALDGTLLKSREFADFKPALVYGVGINYKLTKNIYLCEYIYTFGSKRAGNQSMRLYDSKTTGRYYFMEPKKFSPFVSAGYNFGLTDYSRNRDSFTVTLADGLDPNALGNGIQLDSITHRQSELKLQRMPMHGVLIGAGFDYQLNKRFKLFAEYNWSMLLAQKNKLIQTELSNNTRNFPYHMITAGLTIQITKPTKQLLAQLKEDQWRNSKPIDIKGTIIYKNPDKRYDKLIEVLKTDTLENVISTVQSDPQGITFYARNITPGNYNFMLEKRLKRIARADLLILNYNKVEIADEELELEMVEDQASENIISRDANFSVLLREGFQHEVDLTTTAENLRGRITPLFPDTACAHLRLKLKDKNDSLIATIDTLKNCDFNFVDVPPGNYKLQFERKDGATDKLLNMPLRVLNLIYANNQTVMPLRIPPRAIRLQVI